MFSLKAVIDDYVPNHGPVGIRFAVGKYHKKIKRCQFAKGHEPLTELCYSRM